MKPNITKKPKPVDVFYKTVSGYATKYICPSCKAVFHGAGPDKNVTRFFCACGQELIVKTRIVDGVEK